MFLTISYRALRSAFLLLGLAFALALPAHALPRFAELKASYTESDAWLLARDGQILQSTRIDLTRRRLPWTRIEDVSPALLRALLASEDRKFYEHSGVDWGAAAVSAWRNLWNTRTRGASTLSMQLVGLLDDYTTEAAPRRGRRSVSEKITQATSALWLEKRWKKDEILEAYLNLAGFRGEMVGVAAMSRGLFGKWPDGLDEREAALAASLLRAPGASAQSVATRACDVWRAMAQMKRSAETVNCEGLEGLARLALSGGLRDLEAGWLGAEQSPNLAPHLAQKQLRRAGERFKSTLDADLQNFANTSLREQLQSLAKQNASDGALLVLDNASGDVLAWVGSSGFLSEAPEVDGVVALRQAGSTLKPFLYALAFERRDLTAASLIDDSPLAVATTNGLYVPQNYEPHYRGWVSARMALGGSLNVPAVRALLRIGPDVFRNRLVALGFKSLTENGDYYGTSLALGSADISLLMLANAYRALANGGTWSPLRVSVPSKTEKSRRPCSQGGCDGVFADDNNAAEATERRVIDAAASFITSNILSDRSARVGTFGLESWLATPYWSAAKTGTSKDMRDNWCVGYSARYTVAVWVGNAAGEAMHDVSGVSGAAPVWREVMDWLQRSRKTPPSQANTAPSGVELRQIRFEPPNKIGEAARQEWFVSGTAMDVVRLAENQALAHISYPLPGTIIALDPDIPPERQRIALRLSGAADPNWRWQLDGKMLGRTQPTFLWRPSPGKHRLSLLDANARELEAVDFDVRALKGKSGKKRKK